MLKRSVIFAFLVTACSLVACPAQAQQQDSPYSGYRPTTGYTSSRIAATQRSGQSVTTTIDEDASSEEYQTVSGTKVSQKTQKTTYAAAAQQRVIRTAFEGTETVEVDNSPAEYCEECESCAPTCSPTVCCHPCCYWVRTEYLGWWKQGMSLPALVTTNPSAIPSLDDANTVILLGDDTINKDAKSGGRFTLGMWLDCCQSHGLEFTYMTLGNETMSYYASGDDYTVLGRPFFNIETAAADANLIDYPDPSYSGWVNVTAKTKFQGTELLYRRPTQQGCAQLNFLFGWRWLQLKDDLSISESVTDPLASTISLSDQFNTKNNFHGVELGAQWERPIYCNWTLELVGKMALGNNHSAVTIAGTSTADANQGLLALDSNSGTHTRDSFSAITELGVSLKRQFGCGLEATFGYTFVYWSDVMRAGDQIDLNVDPRQIPPDPVSATLPAALMNTTDFWAQGLHCGLEYAF